MKHSDTINIDELLDGHRVGARQVGLAIALLSMFFLSNFCMSTMALTAPALAEDWSIAAQSLALPMSIFWLGTAIGAATLGVLGDQIGRKWTVILAALLAAGATLATSFSVSLVELYVWRALAGLGLGGASPAAIALLTECLPSRYRGFAISGIMLCGPTGIITASLLSGTLIPVYGWESMFVVGGGALLVSAGLMLTFVTESPRFLASQDGRRIQLERALALLGITLSRSTQILRPEIEERASLRRLFADDLRSATLRAWLSIFAIFLVVAALLNWLPTILSQAGFSAAAGGHAVSFWSGGGIIGTIATGYGIARIGARICARLLAAGAALGIAVIATIPFNPEVPQLLFLAPIAFIGFMSAGLMTALFALVTKLYPADIRSTGIGMAEMVGSVTTVMSSFVAIFALDLLGLRLFFFGLAVIAALPLVLLTAKKLHQFGDRSAA